MFNYDLLQRLDYKSLQRADLGNALKFDEIIVYIQGISKDLFRLRPYENELTNIERNLIIQIYSRLMNEVAAIGNFEVKVNENVESAKTRRNNIFENVHQIKRDFNRDVLPVLDHLILSEKKIQDVLSLSIDEKKVQDIVANIQSKIVQVDNIFNAKLKNFDNDFQRKITEVDSLISNARKIKTDAENFTIDKLTQKYGIIFKGQAEKNKKIAIASLCVCIVSLLGLIFLTYRLFTPLIQAISNMQANTSLIEYLVVNAIFRLTLLGISYVFVRESLKNFNVNMHLYNLNLHRQNALESFDTLISNTRSNETRDQIIKDISQTIYSNQDDGYLHVATKAVSLGEIAELIKALR
jgi:hypothetical protein